MFSHRSFTDTAFPDREIRIYSEDNGCNAAGKLQIFEKSQKVFEMKVPDGINVNAFVRGIFEGFKYENYELRSMLFKS